MMRSICLVRHGPVVNPENRIYGWQDVELWNPPEQILDIVSPDQLSQITTVVSSDLKRCQMAAECLARRYKIPLIVSDCIREQSFGDWEGMTWDEVKMTDFHHWKRFFSDWLHERPPHGESFLDMANRILTYSMPTKENRGNQLWITHAGPIRVLLCHEQKKPLTAAFDDQCLHYAIYSLFLR